MSLQRCQLLFYGQKKPRINRGCVVVWLGHPSNRSQAIVIVLVVSWYDSPPEKQIPKGHIICCYSCTQAGKAQSLCLRV